MESYENTMEYIGLANIFHAKTMESIGQANVFHEFIEFHRFLAGLSILFEKP